jgi:hypothetical protein
VRDFGLCSVHLEGTLLKGTLRYQVKKVELCSSGSGYGLAAGFCENGTCTSGQKKMLVVKLDNYEICLKSGTRCGEFG